MPHTTLLSSPTMSSSSPLPNDAIFEILTRLPLQTLARSRLVNSAWNRITYEPTFTDLHTSRTKTAIGYFTTTTTATYIPSTDAGPTLSLSFLPCQVKIVASDRGILLCVKDRHDKHPHVPEYYVCKPTTKEFTKIPNPKTRFFTEKIAIVVSGVSPLKYKIIRISEQRDSRPFRMHKNLPCEVYDSGLGAWKRSADIKIPYDHIFGRKPIIIGDEAVWLSNNSMFVFDSFNEKYEILPISVPDDCFRNMQLTKNGGKVCLLRKSDDNEGCAVNVWKMENGEWKKEQCLKKPYDLGFLVGMKNDDVAVFAGCGKMRFYDYATGSIIRDVKAEGVLRSDDVLFYSSDYEPCNC